MACFGLLREDSLWVSGAKKAYGVTLSHSVCHWNVASSRLYFKLHLIVY